MSGGVYCRCLASLQSAFHAVEGAAQAVQVPLQDSFLQQAYSLIIMKLRSACQLRLRLVSLFPCPFCPLGSGLADGSLPTYEL